MAITVEKTHKGFVKGVTLLGDNSALIFDLDPTSGLLASILGANKDLHGAWTVAVNGIGSSTWTAAVYGSGDAREILLFTVTGQGNGDSVTIHPHQTIDSGTNKQFPGARAGRVVVTLSAASATDAVTLLITPTAI